MKPFHAFAQERGDLPKNEELDRLLTQARTILEALPYGASCHDAAQAWVDQTKQGTAIRGYFFPSFQHSWIEFDTFILDIYPVGGARPHILAKIAAYGSYHKRGAYSEEPL